MASATFENGPAVRALWAAIWAERARRHPAPARQRSRRDWASEVRPRGRARQARRVWRGAGASAVIAGGYVAVMAGLRWALGAAG